MGTLKSEEDKMIIEEDKSSEKPYIMCTLYYLAVILFIGLPMWYHTCSSTRYSLPEVKLQAVSPGLHLDISVVQLATPKGHDEYIRSKLPSKLSVGPELVYNVNWRIRRPTQEENVLMKSIGRDNDTQQRQTIFSKLETTLLKIHKPSNRFRLFMYLLDEPLQSLLCERPNTYMLNFERFVYLCPDDNQQSLVDLIQSALHETYASSIDFKRVKKILGGKTDLLISLIPEEDGITMDSLSALADKIHSIYERNVKSRFLELAEVLNIRVITQHLMDFRVPVTGELERSFHLYESRLAKHSAQHVHHVMTIVPNPANQTSESDIMEGRDANFIFRCNSDKCLVLGMRAIIRRMIGLSSANLCQNCVIQRDVFFNKWELDAIVGALTTLKFQSVLVSLRAISQQATGIKIPKYVSNMAHESYDLVLQSMEKLEMHKQLEAFRLVSSAHELSEAAFYDPSLLDTLHFPDELKYAIYAPLLLPMALSLAFSVWRLIIYLKSHLTRAKTDHSINKEKLQ